MTPQIQDPVQCELCGDTLPMSQTVIVEQQLCCRPCSVSIRADVGLVDCFIQWHQNQNIPDLKITRMPKRTEGHSKAFAVCEFEFTDIMGTICMRADGQCDADAIRIASEDRILCTYDILVTTEEVTEYLIETYKKIRSEPCVPGS